MNKILLSGIMSVMLSFVSSQNLNCLKDSFPSYGHETKTSTYFKEKNLNEDLIHYLDNTNDFITYESETTGEFNIPDLLIFSVSGNSYRWNKYYLDGFRTDSRFFTGSSFYIPDMFTHGLDLNYYNSELKYNTNKDIDNSLSVSYNTGGWGGISPYTEQLVNLFHNSASERLYKPSGQIYSPIDYRDQMKAAGSVVLNYTFKVRNKYLHQQISADVGTRMLTDFNQSGISDFYPENFSKIQMNGDLPFTLGKLFDDTHYIVNILNRDHLFSEFYYGEKETAKQNSLNVSLYGTKKNNSIQYTSGFTFATHSIIHNNLDFSRNIVDQDGEGFEPWYPDSRVNELSHSVVATKDISKNTQAVFNGFNSVIGFMPGSTSFHNSIYAENDNMSFVPLYIYEWNSAAFTSGLLENSLGLQTKRDLSKSITLRANLNITLDGMFLKDKSVIRPNWEGQLGFHLHPSNWFSMEVNLSRHRVSYNFDDIRYMSNQYLNGDIYYWNDQNHDHIYQENEKSGYFTSTGGKYHSYGKNVRQPSYFAIDIPFYFKFGKHEISILNTFRKYNDNLTTVYDQDASSYGYYKNVDGNQIYFLNNGEKGYKVINYPAWYMSTNSSLNFLTNSPFYAGSTMKYQFESAKFLFSLSWTSYEMAGISTLGNGPLHNNLGVYSETTANPNLNYKLIGRLDQDRAYVARILATWKTNSHLSFSLTGKFKDGQPFTSFATDISTDIQGNNQIAVWDERTKGINVFNGDFGSRKDAFFNIDFTTVYKNKILNHSYELQLMVYNLYDFGTEITEYTFQPTQPGGRYPLFLNIPRGLMLTARVGL